jgi:hypothetical protein
VCRCARPYRVCTVLYLIIVAKHWLLVIQEVEVGVHGCCVRSVGVIRGRGTGSDGRGRERRVIIVIVGIWYWLVFVVKMSVRVERIMTIIDVESVIV